jgi:2-polyprenyl-6-methoxyphenol hydroxylase-like FAD-dependent oxidoreductase
MSPNSGNGLNIAIADVFTIHNKFAQCFQNLNGPPFSRPLLNHDTERRNMPDWQIAGNAKFQSCKES